MEGFTWSQIFLFFFIYCFLGWIFESTYVSLVEHHWTNRGFLRGPMIPIYGFGAMMIVFATEPFRGYYVAEFFSGMIAATLFELLVGLGMEAIFKVRYWDYSRKRFQYKGYICLESSLCWGVLSVVAAEVLQAHIERLVFLLPAVWSIGLAVGVSALFLTDTVLSIRDAWGVRRLVLALDHAKAELENVQRELEARSEAFVQRLETRAAEKRAELEQLKEELDQIKQQQREQLAQEIAQLRQAIAKEKQERDLAQAQLAARVERNVTAWQLKLEEERASLYETLRNAKAEYEEQSISKMAKRNLLLQGLSVLEEQMNTLLRKRGSILRRNPGAVVKNLGNLQRHFERLAQRKKAGKEEMTETHIE